MFRSHRIIVLLLTILSCISAQPAQALSSFGEYSCDDVVSPPAQPLQYDPALNKWWFSGTVIEIQHIRAIGMPAGVAYIESDGFNAWVFQSFETGARYQPVLRLGRARVGDQVEVSISGPHVLENQVDWDLCEPRFSLYCSKGWLYDAGPFAPDIGAMISPSNEFIHFGHPNPSWEQGLYWNTKKLKPDDRSNSYGYPENSRSRRSACPA